MRGISMKDRKKQLDQRKMVSGFIIFSGLFTLLADIIFYLWVKAPIAWEVALVAIALIFYGHRLRK
ncbi:MAG: hypothetical protein FWF59_14550 [Turicibacter sp.]|nr:hypothetical protein [Turicibacter sp.]